jgi:hypothetical protein
MTYLVTLILVTGALIGWGLLRRDGGLQYPFLAGLMFGGWVIPQLWGMQGDPHLPDGSFARVTFMGTLCAGMCLLGYIWPSKPMVALHWEYDQDRLIRAALFLTLFGTFFSFLYDLLPKTKVGGQMSGLSVALLFFADVLQYGFALAVLVYARSRSKWALAIAAVGAYFYLQGIIVGGRRATASEFFFVLALSLWFGRRKSLHPIIILLIACVGIIGSFSIGDYRNASFDEEGITWREITAIEWIENTEEVFKEGGGEMRAATYQMAATAELETYDYGVYHWNRLVFRYVPAQLLGRDVKEALILDVEGAAVLAKERNDVTSRLYGFTKTTGLTTSGLTDAFGSFWYFGALKFFIVAFVLSKIYRGAVYGNVTAQLLYIVLVVPAMHAVTHNTSWFFEAMPHMILFFLPALLYARTPSPRRSKEAQLFHSRRAMSSGR